MISRFDVMRDLRNIIGFLILAGLLFLLGWSIGESWKGGVIVVGIVTLIVVAFQLIDS